MYPNAATDLPISGTGQNRQSSSGQGYRERGGKNLPGLSSLPEGDQPGKIAHHMQLVNSIINDGSLHNLVFSNGTLNSEYLQSSKAQVAKLIQGGGSTIPPHQHAMFKGGMDAYG